MSSEVAGLNLDGMVIVTVGRLVYQKGFDILLKAFHMMRGQVRSRLLIIGDGAEREGLVNLAKQLNISKDTIFAGYKSNPYRYMRESTVFCSASRYEGFSIVILEAMVLGLPVIATDCPSGPAEILDSGRHGILVPPEDPEAIADKLLRVLPDIELRRTLSGRSLLRAQDFNLETFLEQWEELIEI
ncbi:N-acetylgalactosamine-N, N'-diacetylbacillosaminyl-diphospho-undecaprenol4-alpha-N-acetylgalactosaminyltransferase [bacterium BMS3Abin08]|nr:N-acetylgalactosamine-N, N'-diacetylbacillosaminyl-diphospho-undecaprenol4-alpha-N-acetylgalactosaminyltransferase [bacterium BMS3Abin08]